jgi:hypothetical protein
MIRMIVAELAGHHLEANPADILRTVGRPPVRQAGRQQAPRQRALD